MNNNLYNDLKYIKTRALQDIKELTKDYKLSKEIEDKIKEIVYMNLDIAYSNFDNTIPFGSIKPFKI